MPVALRFLDLVLIFAGKKRFLNKQAKQVLKVGKLLIRN